MKGCVLHTTADSYCRIGEGGTEGKERKDESEWEVRQRRTKGDGGS